MDNLDGSEDTKSFKEQFQSETSEWEQFLGPLICLSDRVEVNTESDWWLEYLFNSIFQFLTKLGNVLTLGFCFQDEEQKGLDRRKKEDDYRPKDAPASEIDRFLGLEPPTMTWDYRDCVPYLYRKIHKRRGSRHEAIKSSVSDFQSRILAQFNRLKSPKYKDMRIICGDYIFLVDSHMLRSQSIRFFRHLFQTPDDAFKSVEIKDLSPKELEALLVYIYCRTWPTYVMEFMTDSSEYRRPSKRFLEILENYGVSLSIDKSDDATVVTTAKLEWMEIGTAWDRDEFLADTVFVEILNPGNEKDENGLDEDKNREISILEAQPHVVNENNRSSQWNFDFVQKFVYRKSYSITHPIEQDEDWTVKQEQGFKLLQERPNFNNPMNLYTKLTLTSDWVAQQHFDS